MNARKISTGLAVAFCAALLPAPLPAQTNPPVPPAGTLSTPYRVEIVASRLQAPWSLVFTPDGRLFVSERPGWVRVIEHGQLREEPALVLPDVIPSVKMGLLGMAADPGFATNRFLYLAYNYDTGKENFRLRIARYREAHNRLIEPRTLIDGIPAFRNHTGCRLRFGPDACLYLTTGDANQPPLAQRLDSFAGKILRLNPDGSVPPDNPFVGRSNALAAVWSYGHRNPQGLDFQPGTGALFVPEHGPNDGDEINRVLKGENYGWPLVDHRARRDGLRSPLLEFTPSIGPAAAMFYRGSAFPELKGDLLVGCLRGEGILRVRFDGTNAVACERLLHRQYGRIREVAEGPDGFIYFTTSQFDPPEGTPRPDYDLVLRLVPKDTPPTGAPLAAEWRGDRTAALSFDPATTDAGQLVAAYCAPCHGPGLRGGLQRGLLDGKRQFARDDEGLRRILRDGLGDKGMPAFGGTLKAGQADALIAFIKQNEINPTPGAANATTNRNSP